MRDINEESNSSSWPPFYGDKAVTNGQYYNGFIPRTVTDAYPGYDKDVLKQKMLEHEAIFKNQVYELHRLYRIQRDMMEDVKRMELRKHQISIEPSSSSSHLPSQMLSKDAYKWHIPSLPLPNSSYAKPSAVGAHEIINSPLSCTKGYNTPADRVPSQNGCSSDDCEVLESRPSKVRKKLFNFQLSADDYIDTEEAQQLHVNKISEIPCYTPNGTHRVAAERSSLGLADLNEPIQVDEAHGPTSVDFLPCSASHGDIGGPNKAAKPKSPFLGLPQEYEQNFQHGRNDGILGNLTVEHKGNRREWLSCICEKGNSKSNLNSSPQHLQSDKLPFTSHPSQLMFSKPHQPPGIFSTDRSRRESTACGIEISDRTHDHSNYNRPEPVLNTRLSSPYLFAHSSDYSANSWSGSLTQKFSVQTHPSFNSPASLSRNSQSSNQTREIFRDKWHVNGSSRSNPGLTSELPSRNGFNNGSSSGTKELSFCFPSIGFDNPNYKKGDNVINHFTEKSFKGSNIMDSKSLKGMNLNVIPKTSLTDAMDEKNKCDDPLAVLPWLRAKPVCKDEVTQLLNNGTPKDCDNIFTRDVTLASSGCNFEAKKEIGDCLGTRRIPGFPIFENPRSSKNGTYSLVSTSATLRCPPEGEGFRIGGKHRLIDINVACDPTEASAFDKGTDAEIINFRNHIDLNSCVSEEVEDPSLLSVVSTGADVKNVLEIDLEAPVFPETEESILHAEEHEQNDALLQSPQCRAEHPGDEFARTAAEAIIAMSSFRQHRHIEDPTCHPSEDENTLLWFAEVVSTCVEPVLDGKFGSESRGGDGEIDYFEAMTLQLIETKEEDYMPMPLVPEIGETEPASLRNRSRRGPARRGRQRRDFQRDILPGLSSLARHEVTEDLQTFGGLMRATGHPWKSGLTRRNVAAARRRQRAVVVETPVCTPLMQHLNNFEVGLENRSLTGWGKTTRRPRRQRCPAGNPVTVTLT